jgi:copper chaperone CopZ
VAAVTQELSKLESVRNVEVDLASGAVSVESDTPLSLEAIAEAIDEAGYELSGAVSSQ